VRFRVEIDGRVSDCIVTQSSGSRELDDNTCRLIRTRYRFRAPRDESGRPVPATVVEDHEWIPHPRGD
jgi:protein TonB